MATEFDLAQSFYIDPESVLNADTIYITGVDLYFNQKPVEGKTKTGIAKPGVSLYVCPVVNEVPDLEEYYTDSVARLEYDSIVTSNTATTATSFSFDFPVPVKTNKTYAFLVKFDGSDNDFKLWWNKSGEKVLNTNQNTQVSSGKVDGFFYSITNGKVLTALRDADLKFVVKIAKFTEASKTYKISNKEFEFFTYFANSVTGNFFGGEYVYQNTAPSNGSISVAYDSKTITGTSTTFTSTFQVGDQFVISDGTTDNTDVHTIASISNNTLMSVSAFPSFSNSAASYYKTPVGQVFDYNTDAESLFLENSSANSSVRFTTGQFVKGVDSGGQVKIKTIDNYEASYIRPMFNFFTPAGTIVDLTFNFANSTYHTSDSNREIAELDAEKFIDSYPAIIASRSNEIVNATDLFTGSKTFEAEASFVTNNIYTSPYIKEETLDFFTYRFVINNSTAGEVTPFGNSASKYVSKRVVLADGMDSEDIRLYLTAYKPANTDVKVYVKFHNVEDPEPFDDKEWTELEQVVTGNRLSSSFNRNDFIEIEYKVPTSHPGTEATGTFVTQSGNNVILGNSGTVNTDIAVGSLVRVYQPNVPGNEFIDIVTAANTTSFTVVEDITSPSLVGAGFKVDVIENQYSAFLNLQNSNIIRYYNKSLAAYDGYKTFTVKIVMTAENSFRVPYVDNVRAVAVSA